MVEYLANSPPCALGDFARALHSADADVLAGHGCALADIARSIERVKRDKIARTLPNPLGRRPSALGGSFADVSCTPAEIATGAGLPGLSVSGSLRCPSSLRWGLGLAVLTRSVLPPEGKCESK